MKSRRTKTWRAYALEFGVTTCDGPAGCRKKWSTYMHRKGRVDQMGVIHWDNLDRRATVRGAHRFLTMVGLAKHRPWRSEPEWLRLYHAGAWASYVGTLTIHMRIPYESTLKDRLKVRKLGALAHGGSKAFMHAVPNAYAWAWYVPRSRRRMVAAS